MARFVIEQVALRHMDETSEAFNACRDIKFWGSERFKRSYVRHFNRVALVDAESLEQVFEVCNLWRDEDAWRVTRIAERMHSLSVGDVVHDCKECRTYMCDPIGWTDVTETFVAGLS